MVTLSPLTAIVIIAVILFIIWLIWGGGTYEHVDIKTLLPRAPERIASDVGSSPMHVPYVPHLETRAPGRSGDLQLPTEIVNNSPVLPAELNINPVNINTHKHKSKQEQYVCEAAARVFGVPFDINVRPDWMTNPETNQKLELDCYSDELKIGIEFNGIHHYVYPNWTRNSKEDFIKQYRRDQLKPELCDAEGVYLITVPYSVPQNKYDEFIRHYSPEEVLKRKEEIVEF